MSEEVDDAEELLLEKEFTEEIERVLTATLEHANHAQSSMRILRSCPSKYKRTQNDLGIMTQDETTHMDSPNSTICKDCELQCESLETLAAHIIIVHLMGTIEDKQEQSVESSCPLQGCDQTFATTAKLDKHLSEDHGEMNIYQCVICERVFRTKISLERHSRLHTDERPFECEVCKKRFPWPEHLKAHMAIHQTSKNWMCKKCGREFTASSALRKHERMHNNDFRYVCEYCGEGFFVSEPYKIHLRQHEGVKPFQCGVCAKYFFSRATCKKHTMLHVDETPATFNCEKCEKPFKTQQSLVRHMQLHFGPTLFPCGLCGMGLSTKNNMVEHIKKIHHTECNVRNVDQIVASVLASKANESPH